MVKKNVYDWISGVPLDEHSRRKLKILEEYFRQYLLIRCKLPQQSKFRLAIVDGFCGGGVYECGSYGSPLLFLTGLQSAYREINTLRAASGLQPLVIECVLILNDESASAIEVLKENAAPIVAAIGEEDAGLHISVSFFSEAFETLYPKALAKIQSMRLTNRIFNLDQCGYSDVTGETIRHIMSAPGSSEIFLTFGIQELFSFISRDVEKNTVPYGALGISAEIDNLRNQTSNKGEWLGEVEKAAHSALKTNAKFVSPFSVHNPNGWRYWLLHFANNHRARQAYNDILHKNSSMQAHFGRPGLNMLAYNPQHEDGALYLFDEADRKRALDQLYDDIPRVIKDVGDAMLMSDFYEMAYRETPAHSDDIHEAIMLNEDLTVMTPSGGPRRVANAIKSDDIIKMTDQTTMYPLFGKLPS